MQTSLGPEALVSVLFGNFLSVAMQVSCACFNEVTSRSACWQDEVDFANERQAQLSFVLSLLTGVSSTAPPLPRTSLHSTRL